LCGQQISVFCADPAGAATFHQLLRRHLAMEPSTASPRHESLCLSVVDGADTRPTDATLVHAADHIGVWRLVDRFWLEARDARAVVDTATNSACFTLGSDFALLPGNSQRDLVALPLVMLLRGHGVYALHASGMQRKDTGLLVVGPSGSGKTTTTLTLVSRGWRFLGDDVVALTSTDDACLARALRRSMTAAHATLARFGFDAPPYPDDEGGTPPFDLGTNPDRVVDSFSPTAVVFPEIVDAAETTVTPTGMAETLARLASSMGGIMTDTVWAKRQLDAAARLAEQATGYRLMLGDDVHREPALLPTILSEAGVV
jgi:hypothetical protein